MLNIPMIFETKGAFSFLLSVSRLRACVHVRQVTVDLRGREGERKGKGKRRPAQQTRREGRFYWGSISRYKTRETERQEHKKQEGDPTGDRTHREDGEESNRQVVNFTE